MVQIDTLYDWLMKITGMTSDIAYELDELVPDVKFCSSPQALWAFSGIDHRERAPDYDPKLTAAIYTFFDGLRALPQPVAGSLYDRIFDLSYRQNIHNNVPADKSIIRARRKAAQVFLGHVWEAAFRIETDKAPLMHFNRSISPEVPYPDV